MWISIVWCVWLGISFFMDRRVLDDQLLLIGGSIFFLGGCLALYYFQGTSLILLRSWCEIGLVFLREAFPTITLNSSTVNFFPNCSSLLLAFQEIYFSSCCLSSIGYLFFPAIFPYCFYLYPLFLFLLHFNVLLALCFFYF